MTFGGKSAPMSTETITPVKAACYHCGDICGDLTLTLDEKTFCCEGCKTVYQLLEENGLCQYYDLEKSPGITIKSRSFKDRFAYLDQPEVIEKLLDYRSEDQARISFYIPSIHCASCIWLIENLYKLKPGVLQSEVNYLKKQAYIIFRPGEISLRQIVELLTTLGYEPDITLHDIDTPKAGNPNRELIFKVGIAGFCFGNIMLFSFPEYFHLSDMIDPGFRPFFGYLNILLSLPLLLYSGAGYFRSAWQGLKHKIINIDFPLSLGILVMFGRSSYEIISGTGAGFMDALAGLIFFLLVGKWFQNKTFHALSFERDYKSYFPVSVTRLEKGEETSTTLDQLEAGDIIQLRNNELIPADGILLDGNAWIDYSFVTGESKPVGRQPGEKVYAGGKQTSGIIRVELTKTVSQSYLTQLWNQQVFTRQSTINLTTRVNTVSKYFTFAILSIAIGAGIYWAFADPSKASNAVTAVLIITCPCALALTVPFTFGNTIRIFGRRKLYLKNAALIEDLAKIDTIVLDKTGTITTHDTDAITYEGSALSEEESRVFRLMLKSSTHPLSKAIYNYVGAYEGKEKIAVEEISGSGLTATVDGHTYRLGSAPFVTGKDTNDEKEFRASSVYLSVDDAVKGYYRVENKYREGIEEMIRELKKDYSLHLLSGDNEAEQGNLRRLLGEDTPLHFHQTPADKLSYIEHLQQQGHKVLMLGDGLNDAGALKQADAGIAVSDGNSTFFPACDGMLNASELRHLPRFLQQSRQSLTTTKLSFFISLVYNLIGLFFAVRGELLPVIAAVLMPISSVSVIAFTVLRTNLSARKLQLLTPAHKKHDQNHIYV